MSLHLKKDPMTSSSSFPLQINPIRFTLTRHLIASSLLRCPHAQGRRLDLIGLEISSLNTLSLSQCHDGRSCTDHL